VYDIWIVSIRDRYIPFTRKGKGGVGLAYLPSKSWIELGPLWIVDYLAEGGRHLSESRRVDLAAKAGARRSNVYSSNVD